MIEIREIAAAECPEDLQSYILDGSKVFGAFDQGSLVAAIGACPVILIDPVWVAPEHRQRQHRGRALLRLWLALRSYLADNGAQVVLGIGNDAANPGMSRRMLRMGGSEIPSPRRLFLLPVRER